MLAKVWGFLSKRVKANDFYGQQITFTYKGEDRYRTLIGGCASAFIKIILLIYGCALVTVVLNRSDTK